MIRDFFFGIDQIPLKSLTEFAAIFGEHLFIRFTQKMAS